MLLKELSPNSNLLSGNPSQPVILHFLTVYKLFKPPACLVDLCCLTGCQVLKVH